MLRYRHWSAEKRAPADGRITGQDDRVDWQQMRSRVLHAELVDRVLRFDKAPRRLQPSDVVQGDPWDGAVDPVRGHLPIRGMAALHLRDVLQPLERPSDWKRSEPTWCQLPWRSRATSYQVEALGAETLREKYRLLPLGSDEGVDLCGLAVEVVGDPALFRWRHVCHWERPHPLGGQVKDVRAGRDARERARSERMAAPPGQEARVGVAPRTQAQQRVLEAVEAGEVIIPHRGRAR